MGRVIDSLCGKADAEIGCDGPAGITWFAAVTNIGLGTK